MHTVLEAKCQGTRYGDKMRRVAFVTFLKRLNLLRMQESARMKNVYRALWTYIGDKQLEELING